MLYAPVSRPWWALPARLLRVVADRRTAMPNPLIYLMAAGVGLVLGIALDLLLGLPWWATAAGVVAGAWLLFMATAFRGPRRAGPGEDLWTDFLLEISPARSWARRERLEEQMWRSAPLRLYGLPPTWKGPRFLGGWGSHRKGITSLELLHGDALGEGRQLRVEVLADPSDAHPRALADTLWDEALRPREGPRSPEDIVAWHRARERELASRPDPEWQSVSIPIDGEGVAFQLLTEGSWWIAQGRVGELRLILRGHDFPSNQVTLVSVKNVEPYIEGSRRQREQDELGQER